MVSAFGDLNGSGNQQVWVYTALSSQDINGNYSQYYGEIRYYGNGWGSWTASTQYWGGTFAGQNVSGTFTIPQSQANQSYTTLWTGYYNVGHNADGTMGGFGISASIDTNHSSIGDGTASATEGAAPTIPRASTPSFVGGSSLTTGTAVTINTNWASSGFTHDIVWNFGSLSNQTGGFSASTGIGASLTWTPPVTMLAQIPNSTSGTGNIVLTTKSGGTVIGTKTVAFTLTAASSVIPTISSVTIADQNATVVAQVGAYVQSLSSLKGTVNSAGVQGSTISSSNWSMSGSTVASGQTITPMTSGSVAYGAAATDSRGRVASYSSTLTVLPYASPKINSSQVRRATALNVLNDNGTSLQLDLNAASQSLIVSTEKNTLVIKVFTRLYGTTPWTARNSFTHTTVAYNTAVMITGGAIFPSNQSFDVKIEVTDKFNTAQPTTSILTVSTSAIFMHWSSTGIGIGKYHTQGALDVLGDIYSNNSKLVSETSIIALHPTFVGVVAADWTYGKPNVTLDVDGTVVSAFIGARNLDIEPGTTVLLNRTPGDIWTIVSTMDSGPQYLKQILVPLFSSYWDNYDANPGDTYFSVASDAGEYGSAPGRHSPALVTKSSTGWVIMSGLVRAKSVVGANGLIATLPVGFRPTVQKRFQTMSPANGGITVATNGDIRVVSAAAAGAIISLGNVKFNIDPNVTKTAISGYVNSWVDYGGIYPAKQAVDSLGWGFLEGAVKSGLTTNNTIIATSPTAGALAPGTTSTRHQPGASNSSTSSGGYYIANTGLQFNTSHSDNTFVGLDGGFWDPQALAIPWVSAAFKNSWGNYGGNFPPVAFYKRSDGLVAIRGFANAGVIGQTIFILPVGYRPMNHQIHVTLNSPNAQSRIDIYADGSVVAVGGVNSWLSLEGILFSANR